LNSFIRDLIASIINQGNNSVFGKLLKIGHINMIYSISPVPG
jgi:hypothetical protein